MDPLKLLLILRARYLVATLVAVLALGAGLLVNEKLPARYVAETIVMVDVRAPDPVSALFSSGNLSPGSIGTQLDIIRSDRVGRKVVRMLKLDQDEGVRAAWQEATGGKGRIEDWMARLLLRGMKVAPSRESNMISIAYQGGDPVFVTAVTNAIAQAYIEASVELKVEPARQYSEWFAEQAKTLRENVEKAQAKLSDFQRQRGIPEEAFETEQVKLRELTTRLGAVQAEIRDAQSKQRMSGGDTLPEVMQSTAVQSLRANINQLEVKLKESAGNLGERHPQYLRMQAELAELKNRLAAETTHAATAASSSSVARTREAELRAAIDAQTKRVLGVKKDRDEIAVLMRDVEVAKRAYEAVTTRLTQTNLESQATRTNVTVLTPAIEPLQPSFPMPLSKALPICLVAALVLGILAAFGLEFLDRRVRTAEDLAQMLELPVLAVVEPCRLPRKAAAALPPPAPALPQG